MGSSSSNNRDEIFKKYLKTPPTSSHFGMPAVVIWDEIGIKMTKMCCFSLHCYLKKMVKLILHDIATLLQENLKEGISSEKAGKTPKTAKQIVYYNILYSHYKPKYIHIKNPKSTLI